MVDIPVGADDLRPADLGTDVVKGIVGLPGDSLFRGINQSAVVDKRKVGDDISIPVSVDFLGGGTKSIVNALDVGPTRSRDQVDDAEVVLIHKVDGGETSVRTVRGDTADDVVSSDSGRVDFLVGDRRGAVESVGSKNDSSIGVGIIKLVVRALHFLGCSSILAGACGDGDLKGVENDSRGRKLGTARRKSNRLSGGVGFNVSVRVENVGHIDGANVTLGIVEMRSDDLRERKIAPIRSVTDLTEGIGVVGKFDRDIDHIRIITDEVDRSRSNVERDRGSGHGGASTGLADFTVNAIQIVVGHFNPPYESGSCRTIGSNTVIYMAANQ